MLLESVTNRKLVDADLEQEQEKSARIVGHGPTLYASAYHLCQFLSGRE